MLKKISLYLTENVYILMTLRNCKQKKTTKKTHQKSNKKNSFYNYDKSFDLGKKPVITL